MPTEINMIVEELRQGAIVQRAQAIIDAQLATKSTRQALVDLCGSEHDAEMLAESHDGYHNALEWVALQRAEHETKEDK